MSLLCAQTFDSLLFLKFLSSYGTCGPVSYVSEFLRSVTSTTLTSRYDGMAATPCGGDERHLVLIVLLYSECFLQLRHRVNDPHFNYRNL